MLQIHKNAEYIGACEEVFLNLLFEGVCFLKLRLPLGPPVPPVAEYFMLPL